MHDDDVPEVRDLRGLRVRLGITQTELARVMKIGRDGVSKLESGEYTVSIGQRRKYLDALDSISNIRARAIVELAAMRSSSRGLALAA